MTAQMATVSQKKVLSLILMVALVQGTGLPVTIAVALTAPGMSRNSNEGARQSQNKDRGADASLCMSVSFRR